MLRRRAIDPGFTLIELMITVAIAALLMMISAPAIRDTILNARLSSQASDLLTDIALTRAEAVKRAAWTGLCPSSDGVTCRDTTSWDIGWIAFVDSDTDGAPDSGAQNILKRVSAFENSNTLVASGAASRVVQFRSSGTMPLTAPGVTFVLCDSRRMGRQISVTNTGRAISEKVDGAPC